MLAAHSTECAAFFFGWDQMTDGRRERKRRVGERTLKAFTPPELFGLHYPP